MSESDLISVADAIAVLDAVAVTPRMIRERLERAQGLYLAADIRSDRDYPPFDKSLMDGFAVRCQDVKTTPVELQVVGEVAAGQRSGVALKPGQAMSIMTGAPMPAGADGVVPVEDTEGSGFGVQGSGSAVRILRAEAPSRFITPRGADCAAGTAVLSHGTKLESSQLAAAASFGCAQIDVFARPRVAVLSTGDELVQIDAAPGPAQIRNSNNIMLVALLRRLGCEVTDLGIARDEPSVIRDAITNGLKFDALFISGGMSMGQYDFVPRILVELGVELKITKLKIKPGKPFVFGIKGSGVRVRGSEKNSLNPASFVFGLPGNPVSSFVCALRLASRVLARMSGATVIEQIRPAVLESGVEKNGPREFYQPAIFTGGTVRPMKWKGSADIFTLAAANALIIRPENAAALAAGATVDVLEIPS